MLTTVKKIARHWSMPRPAGPAAIEPLSLRRNVSWTFVGNVVYAGCQWGMIVVLAKLGNAEMVGRFALGFAITAPVILFANLQLRAVQATDATGEYDFGHYLGLRLISTSLALVVILGITCLAGYRLETAAVILVIGVAKAMESFSDVYYGLLQKWERMDRIAISMMIKGPLSLLALGACVYLTGSVFWGVVGVALSWGVTLLLYDVPNAASLSKHRMCSPSGATQPASELPWTLRPCWDVAQLGTLAGRAFPLGVVMMLISLNTNIPRYFIESFQGERELGIFASMAYVVVVATIITGALGQSASPKLAAYYAHGDMGRFYALLSKLVTLIALLGVLGIGIALIAGRWLLTVVYDAEIASHSDVFAWLMAATAFAAAGSILGYAITATRLYHKFTAPYAAATMLTLVCSALLIPKFGILGAAWTVCATAAATCIVPFMILRSSWRRS